MTDHRPVIMYLDIDGCLNASNPTGPTGWDTAVDFQVVKHSKYWNGWIRYSPQLIAELEQFRIDFPFLEIVWCTTWVEQPLYLDRLTAHFGALQGLRMVEPPIRKMDSVPASWKLERILADLKDHPNADVIWIDDQSAAVYGRELSARCDEAGRQLLLIMPDPETERGLLPTDIETIRFSLAGEAK